jgi:WXXGXW repeat (2 copies)
MKLISAAPGYFWVNGAWFWEGSRYAWHPGYWQAPRPPGYRWVAHSWHPVGHGWRMEPGHWVHG